MNLESFLKSVERPAYRMAHLACRNRDDAFDLVQDAMCKFVSRYAAKPEEEWKALFYKTLHSTIIDQSRRKTVRSCVLGWFGLDAEDEARGVEDLEDSKSSNPEYECKVADAADALHAALAELSIRQQQAFLLRSWEELSVEDTAKAMGCSEGSVKTHYFRALQILREKLGEHWP